MDKKICKVDGKYFSARTDDSFAEACTGCYFKENGCHDDDSLRNKVESYLGHCVNDDLVYACVETTEILPGIKIEGEHVGLKFTGYTVRDDEDMPESTQANVVFSDGMFTQLTIEELQTFVITNEIL